MAMKSVQKVSLKNYFYTINHEKMNIFISIESSLSSIQFIPPSRYVSTVPCPSAVVELQLTVVFVEIYATVDNIYVTME